MLARFAAATADFFRAHGASAAFAWGLAKSLLPLPTPSVLVLAGAARPERNALSAFGPILFGLVMPAAGGITAGGLLYYHLARARGPAFVERFGPKFGLGRARAARLERLLGGHMGLLICALRALPFVPVMLGSFVGGLAQQPVGEFVLWSFVGAVLRCLLLAYIGFFAHLAVFATIAPR